MRTLNWKILLIAAVVLVVVLRVRDEEGAPSKPTVKGESTEAKALQPQNPQPSFSKSKEITSEFPKRILASESSTKVAARLDLESQLRRWSPTSQPKVNRQDGIVRQIYGLAIPVGEGKEFKDIDGFVEELSADLEVDKGEVRWRENKDNPYSRQNVFEHRIQGYQVFGSSLRVVTDLQGEKIVYVTNDLQPAREYDSSINLKTDEILELVKEQRPGSKVQLLSPEPVYIVNGDGIAELAWRFSIEEIKNQKMNARELLISTKTGLVLRDINRLFH